jgi:hypothetical protein
MMAILNDTYSLVENKIVFKPKHPHKMKKMRLLLTGILALAAVNVNAQANSQGNFIVDAYYGAPNIGKKFYSSIEDASGTSSFKATGIGPMGIRAEYMVADRVGVGVDVIYNSNNVTYTAIDSTYNGNTDTWTASNHDYKRTMNRVRVQARFNYHFDVSNPDLDAYFGVGAGTNSRYRKFYDNGTEVLSDDFKGSGTLIPVSFRLCTGLRYYFTENIGVNAEIGLGGPLVSAGLSVRF